MFTKVYKLASFVRNSIIIDTYIRFKGALPRSDGATEHGNLTTFNLANFGSADVDAAAAGTGDSLPTSVEAARRPPPPSPRVGGRRPAHAHARRAPVASDAASDVSPMNTVNSER